MQRRQFLSLLGKTLPAGVVASAGAGTYAIGVEPSWIETRALRLPVPNLAPALDGLRVVQLSDLHRSDFVSGEFVREAVDRALELRPELVALTGDFITSDPAYFRSVADELAPLARAVPCYAVPGNHDYALLYPWARPDAPEGGDRLATEFDRVGIRLLRNERVVVAPRAGADPLEVVGMDDFWSPYFDPERAFDGAARGPGRPARLLLSHNPDSFRRLQDQEFELMLAGHTHGGQVRVPLLGSPVVPIEDRRFVAGLVGAEERLVYVNRGLGYSRRIRFGVRPEVTLIELTRA